MKRPRDTTEEADRLQFATWRKMSAEQKLDLLFSLGDLMRANFEHGIAQRHPDYTARQVRMARIRYELGDHLFRQVHPTEPLLPP
ncbi:MAG: hypothetical protein ACOC8A_02155 [bacterium]